MQSNLSHQSFLTTPKSLVLACLVTLAFSLGAQAQERGGRDEQRPQRPDFSSLDLNSDGSVTYEEFSQSQVPNDDHETIFDHIDADGDGEITEEEFTSHKPPRRER